MKLLLPFCSLIVVVCSFFLVQQIYGQTTTDNETPIVADPGTAVVSTLGIAGAAGAIINSVIEGRKSKKNIKGTDVDFATAIVILSKIFQVAYEIDPNWKKTLDTRATSNVLVHTTLGQAFAAEADGWASFIQEQYNMARPSMSVPSNVQQSTNTVQKPDDKKQPDQVSK